MNLKNIGLIVVGFVMGVFVMLQVFVLVEQIVMVLFFFDQFCLFVEVFGQIKCEYVELVDDKKLLMVVIKGMVLSFDLYLLFFDKIDYDELQEQMKGCFVGFGIEILQEDGFVKVILLIEDIFVFCVGICLGDLIMCINDKLVCGMMFDKVVKQMCGELGIKVMLMIFCKSDDCMFLVMVMCVIIKVQSVKMKMFDLGYVYVCIMSFQECMMFDFVQKLQDIVCQQLNLKGFIFDLCNNGGGLLQSVVGVVGVFLLFDLVVVLINGQIFDLKQVYCDMYDNYCLLFFDGDLLKNLLLIFKIVLMIVLMNVYLVFVLEIVVGVLQDLKCVQIMGKMMFGKGLVQMVCLMMVDIVLCLIIVYYYMLSGCLIQNKGIMLDVLVDQYVDGDLDDVFVMCEVDYMNYFVNMQDLNEKKEQEECEQCWMDQLCIFEEQNDKKMLE